MPGSVGQPTLGWFAYAGHKSSAIGTWIRYNDSASLAMGYISNSNRDQNADLNWDQYLDSVTYKTTAVYRKDADFGIATLQFDGVTVLTFDQYAAAGSYNNYSEAPGVVVATPGVKVMKYLIATKNASSTNYGGAPSSFGIFKTSGTHSTPAGTDTPGYTWEWFSWMGTKSTTEARSVGQDSAVFSGGYLVNSTAQNSEVTADYWKDTGTFTTSMLHRKGSNQGISTLRFNATDIGTIDRYNAASSFNNFSTITGTAVTTAEVATFGDKLATKNASSTDYRAETHSYKITRTGT